MSDYSYKILGLKENCSIKDVKTAFRKLALVTHPDKGGSSELFSSVKKAYVDISKILNFDYKDFSDLKSESNRELKQQKKKKNNSSIDPDNFNNVEFNRLFDKHRPKDTGYNLQHLPQIKEVDIAINTALIKFIEPVLVYTNSNFQLLNGGVCSDYSAPLHSKMKYTDCARAFSIPIDDDTLIKQNADVINRNITLSQLKIQRAIPIESVVDGSSEYQKYILEKNKMDRRRQQAERELILKQTERFNKFSGYRIQN